MDNENNSQFSPLHSPLPKGYKQTEVGVIPEDWEMQGLGEGIRLLSGHHVLAQHCNTDGDGERYITGPADFSNGVIQHTKFTTRPGTICRANDILVTVKGSGAGTLVLADANYCISRQLMSIRITDWSTKYVYYSLLQDASLFGAAATGLIPGLSRSDILNKLIPLPPTKAEQEAIAEALSDADALIESLTQLIAKKRQLKQGAMQELLTGKRRLHGFANATIGYKQTEVGVIPEDWEVKSLSSVVAYTNGNAHEGSINEFGKYIVVNSKFISTNGEVKKYSDKCFSPASKGETLMVMSDVPNGRAIARCFFVDRDDLYTVNQRICTLCPLEISEKLLFYKLNRNPFYLAFDDGVKQTNLRKNDVLSCPLVLPSTKVEQEAIAEVLSEMDAEITALETKLTKARNIKQGMMHNLLTGRIRLV